MYSMIVNFFLPLMVSKSFLVSLPDALCHDLLCASMYTY
jgi:hypothetical protein